MYRPLPLLLLVFAIGSCAFHMKTTDQHGEINRDPQPLMRLDTFMRYPDAAKPAKLSGRVVASALVNGQGSVDTVKIESSTDPVFNQAVIDAIKPLRFLPARRDGYFVAHWVRIPMSFKPPQPKQ